jgi:hypothetical protein
VPPTNASPAASRPAETGCGETTAAQARRRERSARRRANRDQQAAHDHAGEPSVAAWTPLDIGEHRPLIWRNNLAYNPGSRWWWYCVCGHSGYGQRHAPILTAAHEHGTHAGRSRKRRQVAS